MKAVNVKKQKADDMRDRVVWAGIMHGWQQDTLENIKKKDIL
jgi:hypothetical protein